MNDTHTIDASHDPALRSWVDSANAPGCDFPIQNLPFGRFRRAGVHEALRIGVAIGDQILDLAAAGLVDHGDMRILMAASAAERRSLRHAISGLLATNGATGGANGGANGGATAARAALVPQSDAAMALPCDIGDYTDFYTSVHHATTVGKQFRPDNPLLPNYKWVPIGYHGRASSIAVGGGAGGSTGEGDSFPRPRGQLKAPDADAPSLAPCRRLDYELELGIFIGRPNRRGEPVPMADAEARVFGIALFNDWSARDIQGWEYQPLGPFLSKNFASTLSPWIVTTEALAPFRSAFARPHGDPQPLPYLDSAANRTAGAFDIALEVWLQTAQMKAAGEAGERLSQSNAADAYWTVAQLVAHHTAGGCNLQTGDLFGSGTLSGPLPGQDGSLLELSQGGRQPITLANGEQRSFLEDGDTVILRGYCERAGARRIGFGECRGTVLPAAAVTSS